MPESLLFYGAQSLDWELVSDWRAACLASCSEIVCPFLCLSPLPGGEPSLPLPFSDHEDQPQRRCAVLATCAFENKDNDILRALLLVLSLNINDL